jgi:Mediator complex subunit 30.
MFDFLEAFEKRMQIVAVVDSVVNRRNRNMELEKVFQQGQLENLVFSVLVYIMDRTLSEDEECTAESITDFIGSILPSNFDIRLTSDMYKRISEYIIKNILQNDGVPLYYPVMSYTQGKSIQLRIKLIDDKVSEVDGKYRISYVLTDQGYDFLFRTKEVEQEINFTIEELKLRELIKRKNYKKALQQSNNLIQMVRQKKKDLRQFMDQIRENIYSVDVGKYEELVNSTYELLQEEYDILNDIKNMITLSENRLREELARTGVLDQDMEKAEREISMISGNITTTLKEQRDLIIDRHSLSSIYIDTIRDAFQYTMEKRYDFEEEVLKKMESCTEPMIQRFWQLLNPLFMPEPYRNLNILNLFDRQGKLKNEDSEETIGIELEELALDMEKQRIEQANKTYTVIIRELLLYIINCGGRTSFSSFVQHLQGDAVIYEMVTENRFLFTTLLKLYDLDVVDIEKWLQEQEEIVDNATGEFDLAYCLFKICEESSNLFGIRALHVTNPDNTLFDVIIMEKHNECCFKVTIEITDFLIEVTI